MEGGLSEYLNHASCFVSTCVLVPKNKRHDVIATLPLLAIVLHCVVLLLTNNPTCLASIQQGCRKHYCNRVQWRHSRLDKQKLSSNIL